MMPPSETTPATIFVRFTFGGFHRWPDAPASRAYLGVTHRHLFHVEVRMTVAHDDREVEFHDLLARSSAEFGELGRVDPINGVVDFAERSCESLARELASILAGQFDRPVEVSVSEDNEVGATVNVLPAS
jgi:hypothetical protein